MAENASQCVVKSGLVNSYRLGCILKEVYSVRLKMGFGFEEHFNKLCNSCQQCLINMKKQELPTVFYIL